MAMIEIKNVSKWYSESFQVLKNCSATVNKVSAAVEEIKASMASQ